jgi:hypothetical protein
MVNRLVKKFSVFMEAEGCVTIHKSPPLVLTLNSKFADRLAFWSGAECLISEHIVLKVENFLQLRQSAVAILMVGVFGRFRKPLLGYNREGGGGGGKQ